MDRHLLHEVTVLERLPEATIADLANQRSARATSAGLAPRALTNAGPPDPRGRSDSLCSRNGQGLETTPIPEARYNILFAVYYVDGRSAYITPKQLAGGEHMVPAIARELQEKGEIPPARLRA